MKLAAVEAFVPGVRVQLTVTCSVCPIVYTRIEQSVAPHGPTAIEVPQGWHVVDGQAVCDLHTVEIKAVPVPLPVSAQFLDGRYVRVRCARCSAGANAWASRGAIYYDDLPPPIGWHRLPAEGLVCDAHPEAPSSPDASAKVTP